MIWAKTTVEVAMLPGMVEVKVGIVAAGVVAYPIVMAMVDVNVGRVGVTALVAKIAMVFGWMRGAVKGRWGVGWRTWGWSWMASSGTLRDCGQGSDEGYGQNS
jgi:hypothetical protein